MKKAVDKHTEKTLETEIVQHLINHGGYTPSDQKDYDVTKALFPKTVLTFLKTSQPKEWEKLAKIHKDKIEEKLLDRLCKELDQRGMIDVLRHGLTDYGAKFKLAFFKPTHGLNPQTIKEFDFNVLTATRQVHYSSKNKNSLDILLSINGLPVATVELKNQFTGQDVTNSQRQYVEDRDPQELLFQFKKRTLVHFSVDTDIVQMTTAIEGKKTRFLPFNKGFERGAGNPPDPNGHRTSYLWEDIWERESWMDIFRRFINLQVEEFKINGAIKKKEKIIFPRYHQIDVVRKISVHAKKHGIGEHYLIQHSAGSGKSNSIAWLAYNLQGLHNQKDKAIFDTVIVISDRRVLDDQLQKTIYQFDHTQGVVQPIDQDSAQLKEHLEAGTKIIITTLQKFPVVIKKIADLPKRSYAIIVDEAHSSQGGESSKHLKAVLRERSLEEASKDAEQEERTVEDDIIDSMSARGKQKNLSFFAFTATPKSKTLQVFGTPNEDGKPEPFHLYSMRQAIEEGFIMDVLDNYTTYQTFYRLSKAIEEDPKVNKKKAKRAIARFMSLHPHNLAQKIEVIVEHFRQVTMKKIGGQAKAMVVTASREHVVRYKHEFDRYIKEKKYTDLRALVAFSQTVKVDGENYTEVGMNGIKEKELPAKFNTSEFQLLIVADKYQTGFDQPLLHTMYVDKKLHGVKAVQTLSRLNRTCPGKEDTFVLDFVNKEAEIFESFQPYYEKTVLASNADPNLLYDLKSKLEAVCVTTEQDIQNFAQIFFNPQYSLRDNAKLNSYIDPAVERFKKVSMPEAREEFKHNLISFLRLYSFLSQVMPFSDPELEKFYVYGKFLLTKLPKRDAADTFKLGGEVALEYYRLQKMGEGKIALHKNKDGALNPASELGMKKSKEEQDKLSSIIKLINQRYHTDWTDADKLFIDQLEEDSIANPHVVLQANSNQLENFKHGFAESFVDVLINRKEQNEAMFERMMGDKALRADIEDYLMRRVYKRVRDKKKAEV
ncbi:type I restriction endonuclease subunit R [Candidatus Woesearchaeota archaeon]|nr:type I restriction endonuclease subunit R [Candidatus Woesearchaeota archaeon]